MKGIILCAGRSTRLFPATSVISKSLLPIYDKPMVYYPLSVLQKAKIRDVLVIASKSDLNIYKSLLKDGKHLGMKISYEVQYERKGVSDAFIIGEDFIGSDRVCLVLGDNIFCSDIQKYIDTAKEPNGATIFGIPSDSPQDFGVIEFDENGEAISIEEKPNRPKSNYIVPGIYFYDNDVIEVAKRIKPSKRGEIEITSINEHYLKAGNLTAIKMDDVIWIDAGTPENVLKASQTICNIQHDTGKIASCIEKESYDNGWITKEQFCRLGQQISATAYGKFILTGGIR